MYHKTIRNIGLIFLLSWLNQNIFAQTVGFVQQDVIKVSGITAESQIPGLSISQKQSARVFVDGLGRGIQTVALKAGVNTNKDIIAPMAYDTLGRSIKSFLPYLGSDSSGIYRSGALTSEQAYYYNTNTDKVAHDSVPYSQQVFENSPMQRMLMAGAVGKGFQPITGQHFQTAVYRTNTTADSVMIAFPDGSFSGYYSAGALSTIEGMDADGRKTIVFTDKFGHSILKKQLAPGSTYNCTYYIYNNAGAISYVVPPKAAHLIALHGYALTQTAISHLIFKYTYNSLGQLIEKTVPGSGVMYIVYDPLNRPVLTQDANLRTANKWNYMKYDAKGRVISQGIYTDTSPADTSRAGMQSTVSALTGYSTTWY